MALRKKKEIQHGESLDKLRPVDEAGRKITAKEWAKIIGISENMLFRLLEGHGQIGHLKMLQVCAWIEKEFGREIAIKWFFEGEVSGAPRPPSLRALTRTTVTIIRPTTRRAPPL